MSSYPKTSANNQPEGLLDQIDRSIDQIDQRIDQELATANTQPQMPIGIPPQPPLGRQSSQMTCPYCSEEIWTRVETRRGLWNWLACLGLCIPLTFIGYVSTRFKYTKSTKIYINLTKKVLFIFFSCCCFAPIALFIDDLKVTKHTCPSCQALVGEVKLQL